MNNLLADTVGRDRIRLGAQVTGYTETGADVVVHLANGETLRTDLLIGSDGVYSRVRKQLVPGSDATGCSPRHPPPDTRGRPPTADRRKRPARPSACP